MKIVATRVNELCQVEYTVVPTAEGRNWMAAYANMSRNLSERRMAVVDEFADRASEYGRVECAAFAGVLDRWLGKADEMGAGYAEYELMRALIMWWEPAGLAGTTDLIGAAQKARAFDDAQRRVMVRAIVDSAKLVEAGAMRLDVTRGAETASERMKKWELETNMESLGDDGCDAVRAAAAARSACEQADVDFKRVMAVFMELPPGRMATFMVKCAAMPGADE